MMDVVIFKRENKLVVAMLQFDIVTDTEEPIKLNCILKDGMLQDGYDYKIITKNNKNDWFLTEPDEHGGIYIMEV